MNSLLNAVKKGPQRLPMQGFGRVIRNGDLQELSNEPEYALAKKGDEIAAITLVSRLLKEETIQQIQAASHGEPLILLPVLSIEETGINKIPLAIATILSHRLGYPLETSIHQINTPFRTGRGADHRLVFLPEFDGHVQKGKPYLLIDDTLAMGGTLAALYSFVKSNGGRPTAAMVMTAHEGALELPVKPGMLQAIRQKHGDEMDKLWIEEFGYGIEGLTQGEAGHLKAAQSPQSMKERILVAKKLAGPSI